MTDEQLDNALNSLRDTYRVPPEPPLETMWTAIDEQLSASPKEWMPPRRGMPWAFVGLAAAASLVMGIGVGRWTAASAPPVATDVASTAAASGELYPVSDFAEPLARTASNYLGETIALLREVQTDPSGVYAPRASSLLATTRLLLDAPSGTSPSMQALLEDLELIFSQLSMLRQGTPNSIRDQGIETIRNALSQRDVVPRARTAVVTLASSED